MFAIIPVINFVIIYFIFIRKQFSVREAFLSASIVWGVLVVVGIELLNLQSAIQFAYVLIFWLISAGILLAIFFAYPPSIKSKFGIGDFLALSITERVMICAIVLIAVLVGLTAFMSAPNSWDAINYHMSRVMFWQQNHSVDHYPTPEFRQLFFQPWTGYTFLHFQILAGSDRFATLVSWYSFAGSVIGISFIVQLLGGSRFVQILSALLAVTIPTAIIEASGVRIDSVVAFWFICLVSLILLIQKKGKLIYVFLFGCSLGLAALTKGTTFLMVGPFFIWMMIVLIKKTGPLKTGQALMLIGFLSLLINAGFFYRNYELCKDPLGPKLMRTWGMTEDMTVPLIISNVFRTTAYQLGNAILPWNDFVVKSVYWLHEKANVNIVDDRSTISATAFSTPVSTHEDSVANFMQTVLLLIAIPWMLLRAFRSRNIMLAALIACIVIAYFIICSSIRWTNHITRYNLPLLILSMALAAFLIEQIFLKKKWLVYFLLFSIFCTSMPYVFHNNFRRLVSTKKQTVFNSPRVEQYFRNDQDFYLPYVKAIDEVSRLNCREVGIYMPFNHWDYPMFVIAQLKIKDKIRFEHVYVNQLVAQKYPLGDFSPCAVIAVSYGSFAGQEKLSDHFPFHKIKDFGRTAVFVPEGFPQKTSPEKFYVLENPSSK